ncbi:hypothetical protein RD792_015021 [Penstemon davidsonii]|uniref:PB1 domain-containing protein n=1 Tax=Penstemon davidsonii TaxID=160366 RepID=A0ABR0CQY9_9LAMI|nr:hypothetical protein RD792_015021 [Penstemon davidsonii]
MENYHSVNSNKYLGDTLGNNSSFRQYENSPTAYDEETAMLMSLSQELKDEGNRLFQRRDYEGAMLKYEEAINLLPRNHVNVSYLRSNMAECYMQLGISEYPNAIHECNLALEVTPNYSKALLKRARCYEALNKLDLSLRDVGTVLKMEQSNLMATEIQERVKRTIERQGSGVNEIPVDVVSVPEYIEQRFIPLAKAFRDKARRKRRNRLQERKDSVKIKENEKDTNEVVSTKIEGRLEEQTTSDKLVVEEEKISNMEEGAKRTVKLVFGEDIRWAQIPLNCNILKLREMISNRFPSSKAFLIKYRDQEGDMVTITTTEELRWAEASTSHGSLKLHIFAVSPNQDPLFKQKPDKKITENNDVGKKKEVVHSESTCMSDWIIQFAQFFKNYVGFDIDGYLDHHEVGMKLYYEAMEEIVTSEESQDLFSTAAEKFQEMAALALFNCGNVHISRARKRVYFSEDSSRESMFEQVKCAYDWAMKEYMTAGERYEEALKIKPNFYEAILALGQQQFERAKLSWYYALSTNVDLETWPSSDVIQLYNEAEENIEKGMQMFEEAEAYRLNELFKPNKIEAILKKMKMDNLLKKNMSTDEASDRAANIRSMIYVLWGTVLYERSIMEFKLDFPVWQECLEVSVEKFELAGAPPTDVAVMIKNHCSNDTALEGLGFNIDEIVQAWNEMYEAKRLQSSISSFRLEPLLRRRVSKIYHALEQA